MASELQTVEATGPAGGIDPGRPAARALLALRALGPGRIVALGTVALALLGFFAFVITRTIEPAYTLLYGELQPGDAREIVKQLEALGVPYRLGADGTALMVPETRALELRMDLAADGLPSGGSVGYELLDRTGGLGTSDALTDVNLKRALEGELARTIASLRSIRDARVLVVLPRRKLFERTQDQPSASVVIGLRAGTRLEPRQVEAIRNLVAAAVPGLGPDRVTVVDDRGELLARGSEGSDDGPGDDELEARRAAFEDGLRAKIVQLLERTVGAGEVEAVVTADLDFDAQSTSVETYDPEARAARSTQTVEETTDRRDSRPDAGVSVANNLPTGNTTAATATGSGEKTSRTEETTNFEVSKTLRSQARRGPAIRRLSVAVQVDGVYTTAPDGTRTYADRSPEELTQLKALVRTAAGIEDSRGDVVELVSRPFARIAPAAEAQPGLLDLTHEDYRRIGELATLAVLTILVLLLGVRPLLRRIFAAPLPGPAIDSAVASPPRLEPSRADAGLAAPARPGPAAIAPPSAEGGQSPSRAHPDAAALIEARPADAARVVRGWLGESRGAA